MANGWSPWGPLPPQPDQLPKSVADLLQQETGWRPGTTPSWVPQWAKNISARDTAQEASYRTQSQQPTGPHHIPAAVNPDDMNKLLGFAAPIEAWHGSGADFSAFDPAYVGTGEGAQMYGRGGGGYHAEAKATAKYYQRQAAGNQPITEWRGQPIDENTDYAALTGRPKDTNLHNLIAHARQTSVNEAVDAGRDANTPEWNEATDRFIMGLQKHEVRGRLYQTQIHAEPEDFLHLDKPMHEQSPQIKQAINKLNLQPTNVEIDNAYREHEKASDYERVAHNSGDLLEAAAATGARQMAGDKLTGLRNLRDGTATGWQVYDHLMNRSGEFDEGAAQDWASKQLEDAGAKGMRYFDQMSRKTQAGTHNYIPFDPKLVTIMKKFGIAGAGLTGAAGLGAAATSDQAQAAEPSGVGQLMNPR